MSAGSYNNNKKSKGGEREREQKKKTYVKYGAARGRERDHEENDKFTLQEKFVKKFYDLCYGAGIKNTYVRQELVSIFFGKEYVKNVIEHDAPAAASGGAPYGGAASGGAVGGASRYDKSSDDEEEVLHRMVAGKKGSGSGSKSAPEKDVEATEPELEPREVNQFDVTIAGMVIIKLFNNFLNKDDNKTKLPEAGIERITAQTEALNGLPPYFSFPDYAKVPAKFIENMTLLDVLPQFINFDFVQFDEIYFSHVRSLEYFDVHVNPDGIVGGVSPSECDIAINKNRVVSFDSKKKDRYKVGFLTAISDVSIGKFPKEIKFLPKSIGRFLKKLPTIGACFYAIQDSSNTKSLESWLSSGTGSKLAGDQINPSPEYLTGTLDLACQILDAIHSTSSNRNSHSQKNIHFENKKKFVFPIIFSKFHNQLGHTFENDFGTIKDVAAGLKDFRYLSASIEIAMISSLLMIGTNTEQVEWIQQALGDYFKNIAYVPNETPEEKRTRIFDIANPALHAMISYIKEISQFQVCKDLLTEDESRIIYSWLSSALDLFPRSNNRSNGKKPASRGNDSLESDEVTFAKKFSTTLKGIFTDEDFPPAGPIVRESAAGNTKKTAWRAPTNPSNTTTHVVESTA